MRAAGVASFGVNLFLPGQPPPTPTGSPRMSVRWTRGRRAQDHARGPRWDDDDYPRKLNVLVVGDPPAVVSFTFGVPGLTWCGPSRRRAPSSW